MRRKVDVLLAGALVMAAICGRSRDAAADATDATIYEVQNGVYGLNTQVTCDSVIVIAEGTSGFWVEEPGGGARSGIYVNSISATPPPVGPGVLVTIRGLYKEVSGNSEINIATGLGGFATVVDSSSTVPAAEPLTVGDIRTGSATAESWEGVLVKVDTVLVVDTTAASDWRVIELDGDAPGETLLVDNIMVYDEPPIGTFITSLTGVMQGLTTTSFALEPRANFDILIPDSLPPAAIADLAAVSGTYQGEIDLSWTAPGDDGPLGTALAYTIRRNSVAITDANWASSTAVPGAPTPLTAGAAQAMTIIGLNPGETYFFAIKARDELGNESPLSNSPSAVASTNPPISYQVFWGNLHSHTNLSDGTGTILQAFTFARDTANIDVLAVTDHTHLLTASEYTTIRSTSDVFNATGGFVAIPAQEFGIASGDGYGHMNVWDASGLGPSAAYENLTLAYNWMTQVNKPASFNHPVSQNGGSNFENLAFNFSADAVLEGIEVRNGKRSSDYESQYFQVLSNGWHVGALANQDNHAGLWGSQQNQNSGNDIYLTGILADSLTKSAIMEALANRRFYACEINPAADRVTLNFSANGRIMGSIYSSDLPYIALTATATAAVNNLGSYNLYRNGTIIKTGSINSTNWNFSYTDTVPGSGEYYYFIRLLQSDSDRTWSSPIWVSVTDVTAVAGPGGLPLSVSLSPGVPNPFNPVTKIEFALPDRMTIDLSIYDVAGRRVATIASGEKAAGRHEARWGGLDSHGRDVGSGVYFARLETPAGTEMRKLVLLR